MPNTPTKKPTTMTKVQRGKLLASLKAASVSRDRTEALLFELLQNGKGIDIVTITIADGNFIDISGETPLPIPSPARPLDAEDLFTKHTYKLNEKGPYTPGGNRPSIVQRLKMKAGIPALWKVMVEAANGDTQYIPTGFACFPKPKLTVSDPDLATKVCTEAKVFLCGTYLFILFTDEFKKENLSKNARC